jgi:hypothetical protein
MSNCSNDFSRPPYQRGVGGLFTLPKATEVATTKINQTERSEGALTFDEHSYFHR